MNAMNTMNPANTSQTQAKAQAKPQAKSQKPNATSLKMLLKQSCVWVDPKSKVASFHELAGGMPMQFGDESIFLAFLDGLINNHYRFQ
jgi:flagellar hook-basal body complex protein FliE